MPQIGGILELGLQAVKVSVLAAARAITLILEKPMPTVGGIVLAHPKQASPTAVGTKVGTIQVTLNDGTKVSGQLLATGFNPAFTITDVAAPAPPPGPKPAAG
jgi:hypothetical protein